KILFDPGKTDLKPEGKDALKQVTEVLKSLPNSNFQIAGHTDNAPMKRAKFRSNWDLSTARAVEVLNFMISAGMEPKRVSAAGYGEASPGAAHETRENKAKNRRIEITLVPNLDDLPPIDEALKDNKEGGAPAAAAPQLRAAKERRPRTPRPGPSSDRRWRRASPDGPRSGSRTCSSCRRCRPGSGRAS